MGHRNIVIGGTYTGKTHWVTHTFFGDLMEGKYDRIWWLTGSEDDKTEVEKKVKHGLRKKGKLHFKLNPSIKYVKELVDTIHNAQLALEDIGKPIMKVCLVFDDLMSERELFNPHRPSYIEKIFAKGRHDHIDVIVIAQGYAGYLNKATRCVNPTALILFPIGPKILKEIVDENNTIDMDDASCHTLLAQHLVPNSLNSHPYVVIDKTKHVGEERFYTDGKQYRPKF